MTLQQRPGLVDVSFLRSHCTHRKPETKHPIYERLRDEDVGASRDAGVEVSIEIIKRFLGHLTCLFRRKRWGFQPENRKCERRLGDECEGRTEKRNKIFVQCYALLKEFQKSMAWRLSKSIPVVCACETLLDHSFEARTRL